MNPFAMLGGMPGLAGLMGMGGMQGMQGMQGLNSGQISNMWGGMAGRGNLPGMGQMGGFNRGMMEQVGIIYIYVRGRGKMTEIGDFDMKNWCLSWG